MAAGLGSSAVNLGILLGVMGYYLKQPLKDFVQTRHTTLKQDIDSARQQLQAALRDYEEYSSKLKSIEAEVSAIKTQIRQDAQSAKTRIVDEARRLSTTIVTDARSSAQGLYSELRSQLYNELGAKVLERAETLLRERLTGEDRARIRQEFSHQLERAQ